MLDRIFEVVDNEIDLLVRVRELKLKGYAEEDMYIITRDEEDVSMLKGHTDIMIKEDDHSLIDKFISLLKGEDSITDVFVRMGLEKKDKKYYYNQVKEGKLLLLVDKDYHCNYVLGEDGVLGPLNPVEESPVKKQPQDEALTLKSNERLSDNIKEDIGISVDGVEDIIPPFPREDGIPDER